MKRLTSKIIGKIKITSALIFSIILFYGIGQAQLFTWCSLPSWFDPSFIPENSIITWYSSETATMDSDCTKFKKNILCNVNYVDQINIYKYPSCEDKEWWNCTTDEWVSTEHNESVMLYSSDKSTYDSSCNQLGEFAKCRDGSFISQSTGNPILNDYKYWSCTDLIFNWCKDTWHDKFIKHNDAINVYSAETSDDNHTCPSLKQDVTCKAWNFYDASNNKITDTSSLFGECEDIWWLSCELYYEDLALTWYVKHWDSIEPYSTTNARNCTEKKKKLTCLNWTLKWWSTTFYKYSDCTQTTDQCLAYSKSLLTWVWYDNWDTLWQWKNYKSYDCYAEYSDMTCLNWKWIWGEPSIYKYETCKDWEIWECWVEWTDSDNEWVPHWVSIEWYHANTSRDCKWTENYRKIACDIETWTWWNVNYFSYSSCSIPDDSCKIFRPDSDWLKKYNGITGDWETINSGWIATWYHTDESRDCEWTWNYREMFCKQWELLYWNPWYFWYDECDVPTDGCDIFRPEATWTGNYNWITWTIDNRSEWEKLERYHSPSYRNCKNSNNYKVLECFHWERSWWNANYFYYPSCIQEENKCWYYDIETKTWKYIDHNETLLWYSNYFSYSCDDNKRDMTCLNWKWTWGEPSIYRYPSCDTWPEWACWIEWTDSDNEWINSWNSINWYHINNSRNCEWTWNHKEITCGNWLRLWGSVSYFSYHKCDKPIGDCEIFRPDPDWLSWYNWMSWTWKIIKNWGSTWWYHLNTDWDCKWEDNYRDMQCVDWIFTWNWSQINEKYFAYDHCVAPDGSCSILWEDKGPVSWIATWTIYTWYSTAIAYYPNTCTWDHAGVFECYQWGRSWDNEAYFNYSWCINTWSAEEPYIGERLWIDLAIVSITLNNNNNWYVLWNANPVINIEIRNNWLSGALGFDIPEWLVICKNTDEKIHESFKTVFKSKPLSTFSLPPETTRLATRMYLSNIITRIHLTKDPWESEYTKKWYWPKEIKCTINPEWAFFQEGVMGADWEIINDIGYYRNNSKTFSFEVIESMDGRFDMSMTQSISSIERHLNTPETSLGAKGIQDFIINLAMNVLVPIMIVIALMSVILWLYNVMFVESEDATKKWMNYITWGIIGILIIMSAKFIAGVFFEDILQFGNVTHLSWMEVANDIYKKIIFPFIKIAIYLVLWIMFIILVSRVFTFFMSWDEEATKKAKTIIIRNIIWILIVIWSKQIVEIIFGKEAEVLNDSAENLGQIWSGLLADKNIPLLFHIINWVMWLTALLILIIIIIQTFKLLTDPDNPENIKKIWKSIWYIVLWVVIIWTGYLIVNFMIIN